MSPEFEQARKAAIINRTIRHIVCFGIPALVVGNLLKNVDGFSFKILMGTIIGFSITYGVTSSVWAILFKNRAYARFISLYKKEMVLAALNGSRLYEQQEFAYDCGLKAEFINRTGLVTASKLFSDCYLSGVYNGVNFFQADVRNVASNGNGYILEYDGTMIAIPTVLPDATQTNIYHKNIECSVVVPGKEIPMGHAQFDNTFKVATSSPDKAKALVTSDFATKLLNIQAQINSTINLTVKDGWMYILLPNKKSVLKPKLFGKYDDSMKMDIIKELSRAKLFIDAFSK